MTTSPLSSPEATHRSSSDHFRFHIPHGHLTSVFGNDWFALYGLTPEEIKIVEGAGVPTAARRGSVA